MYDSTSMKNYYLTLLLVLLSTFSLCAEKEEELSGRILHSDTLNDIDEWIVIVRNESDSAIYIKPDIACLNIEVDCGERKKFIHLDFGFDSSKPFEELEPGKIKKMGCLLTPDISSILKRVGWCTVPILYKQTEIDEEKSLSLKLVVEEHEI